MSAPTTTTAIVQPARQATRPNPWRDRLFVAKAEGVDALLAFARALDDDQQAKAWAQVSHYRLWEHSETGEVLGLIKTRTRQYRRVQESYGMGAWHVSGSAFMSTISATNNALRIMARSTPERAEELLAVVVQPKHAYIMRLLIDENAPVLNESTEA